MLTWLQAVLLGILQGATEFIPVSSSGHLVLVPYLAGWERPGLAFDVALHMGSAVAVVAYFRAELWTMVRGVLGMDTTPDARAYRRVAPMVVVASVPIAIVGLALRDIYEETFAQPAVTAGFLFVTAAVLTLGEAVRDRRVRRGTRQPIRHDDADAPRVWQGDWIGESTHSHDASFRLPTGQDEGDPLGASLVDIRWRHAIVVGLCQCLALFPGISRSGTTIVAGMTSGLTREAATRFSFLLSLPALVGAAIISLGDLAESDVVYSAFDITAGVVAATVASYIAIRYLVALVAHNRLSLFARYCLVAGAVGLVGVAMIGPPSGV